jgi:hypothetical protein
MSDENVDLVRRAYDDFNAGNIDAVLAALREDVEWNEPGGGNSPRGTFTGPQSVGEDVFARVPENFDEFTVSIEDARDEGDTVVVSSRFSGTNKSGARLDATSTQTWEIRDGKLARMVNEPDAEAWAQGWS